MSVVRRVRIMSNNKTVLDDQTGQTFIVTDERWFDIIAAWVSIGYSLAVIAYLGWLLLDTWIGAYSVGFMQWYKDALRAQNSPVFRLVFYTAIGGGIGAAVNNIRSFVQWHAERKAFGWRFVWKYISLPPLGATLAVMVYVIIQGGMAVFSGGVSSSDVTAITSFTALATGALSGYGSHKVFIWLDDKVNTLFKVEAKVSPAANVAVPDVAGKTRHEAEQALQASKVALGDVTEEPTSDAMMIGKVISQTPAAGTEGAANSKVAITIGTASDDVKNSQAAKVTVPDVAGKTRDEAAQVLQASKLALGDVTQERTSDATMIGKVISQTPVAGTEAAVDSTVVITIG